MDRDDMLERLERAEAEVRGMRRLLRALITGGCLLAAGAILFGATRPAETALAIDRWGGARRLRAPLVVTDQKGRPVMQVSATPDGGALTLFDRRGKVTAILGSAGIGNTEGRGLAVFDRGGAPILLGGHGVFSGNGIGRGLGVFDERGTPIAALGIGERNGNPIRGLAVVDEGGTVAAALGVGSFGGEAGRGLGVIDSSNTLVAGLAVAETGDRGRIAIRHRNGTLLFDQP